MHDKSYWLGRNKLARYSKVDRPVKVDVAVIGGGIAGVTAAYLLKRAGKSVALLERGKFGHGDTGHTTAHLTYVTDERLTDLISRFGRDHAQAAWDAGQAALQTIHDVVRLEGIACNLTWVPGYLHAPAEATNDQQPASDFEKEAELARELGFDATFMEAVPLFGRPGIRFANQGKFDPLKYLDALLATIPGEGSYVFEQSDAEEFRADPHGVKVNGKWIDCDYFVIMTHVPLQGEKNLISGTLFQTKIASYSSYAVGAKLPTGQFPQASFWDTADPYSYLRIDRFDGYDYAIYGGEDHKTGQVGDYAERYERLCERLSDLLPGAEIDCKWSGQVVETHDGLPLIGEIGKGQFIGTGFAGNGMTFGTVAGMMACDAVLGRKNPWVDLFDPHRKKISSTWDYIKENADYPYYLVKDRLRAAEGKSAAALRPDEAKILRLNGKRVACYRDESGVLHEVSAMCTHMGCVVHWNATEATWDCPCHGSRFTPDGKVIAGPAETPLEKVDSRAEAAAMAKAADEPPVLPRL
jgi:glycine/D-amino acid oxidase-like deaminating enzyme/nitrite reductase/ring-hydroxylating ferredoxin subunit